MTAINKLFDYKADTAIILGSGLGSLVVDPASREVVPYTEFSEIPKQVGKKAAADFAKLVSSAFA
ncbi:MAG TPA: hypothetical protein VGH08_08795 [Chthoniobacterales bacterium]